MAEPAKPEAEQQQQQHKHQALPPAPFWEARTAAFDRLYAKAQAELAAREHAAIKVRIHGVIAEGKAWESTPISVARSIESLKERADSAVAARVNGHAWDLTRPLEADAEVELLPFDSEAGREVFWHSSAHILGQALERKYHAMLDCGPPTETDFWYDGQLPGDRQVSGSELAELTKLCLAACKEAAPFQRIEVTREEARELFAYNKHKMTLVEKVPEGERITVYRCGPLVDLCRGPHVSNTAAIKAFKVTSVSSVYLNGDKNSDLMQRVHALAFPNKQQLKEWETMLEEAAKRDHRKIGQDQDLFFFHDVSPGSCFFLPHGYRIYNKLVDFMKNEYHKRGYEEVMGPNIYQKKLWETSGHWSHYQKNMFTFKCEEQEWGLKPMNCPGHCLMFAHRARSYRELPLRLAEFGVLHRNELSGALHGLTRVRRFQQDDSHIFCRQDQIQQEVEGVLKLIQHTYGIFGFNFRLWLSTMPEDHMGELATWESAESQLKTTLERLNIPWQLNAGDGAFYGPKIDIQIQDALKRFHQCATIQLDFQLPQRFELSYMSANGAKPETPVMIHRAVFGSIERFLAILIEHTAGKWPFWISPRQVCIVPVSEKFVEYANKVQARLHDCNFYVDVDDSDRQLQKKVREAQIAQYNYIVVVGQEEADTNTVNVRVRDAKDPLGKMTIDELVAMCNKLTAEYK
eukprot:m51a1_g14064 putative threonine--trna mitochondrial-like (689) ;mRNA; f:1226813-1229365